MLSRIAHAGISEFTISLYGIELAHFLAHRGIADFHNALRNLTILSNFFHLLDSNVWHVVTVLNKVCQLGEDQVIGDELRQFGEMPAKPFTDSHRQGVDILIQQLQQADRLNDGLIFSVDIQCNGVSRERMRQTKLGLGEIILGELFNYVRGYLRSSRRR